MIDGRFCQQHLRKNGQSSQPRLDDRWFVRRGVGGGDFPRLFPWVGFVARFFFSNKLMGSSFQSRYRYWRKYQAPLLVHRPSRVAAVGKSHTTIYLHTPFFKLTYVLDSMVECPIIVLPAHTLDRKRFARAQDR